MISESTLKKLIVKGMWRYSYLNLGQYVKVDLDPPSSSFGGPSANNARPVILRIVHIEHDRPVDMVIDAPFLIGEQFTKAEIHLSY
jgi:hypothetical protein